MMFFGGYRKGRLGKKPYMMVGLSGFIMDIAMAWVIWG